MILLTGATGFIGSHLLNTLVENGLPNRVLVRNEKTGSIRESPLIQATMGDLANPDSLRSIADDVEIVFHLASIINAVPEAYETYWKSNVLGTYNLLKSLNKHKIRRFVYCSSVGVLGPLEKMPADEDQDCRPQNAYEKTKHEAEKVVRSECTKLKIPYAILRPSWGYGPGDRRTFKLFEAIKKKRFVMIGSGRTLIHPVYVQDVVQALIRCAFHPNAAGKTYIAAGEEVTTLQNLTRMIAQCLGCRIARVRLPLFLAMPAARILERFYEPIGRVPPLSRRRLLFFTKNQAFDISKAKREIGYRPETPLWQGLVKTSRWYEKNGWF